MPVSDNHNNLVLAGKGWLQRAKGCNPVYCEQGSAMIPEIPDVIGWHARGSIIVECKVSMADFMADAQKPFRVAPERGMGSERYYLFPIGLEFPHDKLPAGWGLLEQPCMGQVRQRRLCRSDKFLRNIEAELSFLRSRILEIQRIGR